MVGLQIVGTLADMLLNSTFQPDAIEREKKTILQVRALIKSMVLIGQFYSKKSFAALV
jgi:predicted Zn-dependent peptidase